MNKIKIARFNKISWKLTVFYAGIFFIILIVLSIGIIYGVRYFLIQEAFDTLAGSTSTTIDSITDTLHENHKLTNPELLSESSANSDINIEIADKNGNIVNQSGKSSVDIQSDLGLPREVQDGNNHFAVKNTTILMDGQVQAYLQVSLDLSDEDTFLRILIIAIVIADCIGLTLSLILGNLVSRRMLKPIDNITKAAREISISDLNQKIEFVDNDDELSRLASTFNDMIERLRVSFEKQNAFVSDASHELRTPISVIRGYVDLIDGWGKEDKAVLDEAITAIQNEAYNMESLVEKLLFLARSDTGRLAVTKEKFSLDILIEEIITEYDIIYPERVLKTYAKKDSQLWADRSLIKQALRALIDNGIKFSPEKSEINITVKKDSNNLTISVKDRGIGIPQGRIDRIFERFFRVDSSRGKKTGGTGLGLSIVQIIVNAHGGKIEVESELGQGTVMSITLPQKN